MDGEPDWKGLSRTNRGCLTASGCSVSTCIPPATAAPGNPQPVSPEPAAAPGEAAVPSHSVSCLRFLRPGQEQERTQTLWVRKCKGAPWTQDCGSRSHGETREMTLRAFWCLVSGTSWEKMAATSSSLQSLFHLSFHLVSLRATFNHLGLGDARADRSGFTPGSREVLGDRASVP